MSKSQRKNNRAALLRGGKLDYNGNWPIRPATAVFRMFPPPCPWFHDPPSDD